MGKHAARLTRLQRELDKRTPAEPVVLRFVWHDEATGEEEQFGEVTLVDGRATQDIQLRWPEDEDGGKTTRQNAPGRA